MDMAGIGYQDFPGHRIAVGTGALVWERGRDAAAGLVEYIRLGSVGDSSPSQTLSDRVRLLSLELGRPSLIDDQDCEIGLPSPVEDKYIRPSGTWAPPSALQSTIPLSQTVQVVRTISQLTGALKTTVIAPPTLQSFDAHFSNCINTFPQPYQIHSNEHLDPHLLTPMIYLQNARLVLHRHNLSTMCIAEVRAVAIDYCVMVAKDTVQLLSRSMQSPPESSSHPPTANGSWEAKFANAGSAFLCTHLWRCTLVLCFRRQYNDALVCARASAVLDDARPVNSACGRHLDFFLKCLIAKLQQGEGATLERDEEMMAYVSGDLQNSIESSWVWQGGGYSEQVQEQSPPTTTASDSRGAVTESPTKSMAPQEDSRGWSGWEAIIETLQGLTHDLQRQQQQQQQQQQHEHQQHQQQSPQGQLTPTQLETFYLPPPPPPDLGSAGNPQASPGGSSSRISIANII